VRRDFNGNLQLGGGHATEEEKQSWEEDEKDLSNITHPFSGSERNRLFLNGHGDSFLDVSGISGVDSPSDGRVSVWLDMDRDGRHDLAVVNSNRPLLQLYRNKTGDADRKAGNFIALKFVGGNDSAEASPQFSNRNGFGTRVVVQAGDRQITREHLCGQGFAGQNTSTMLIGLGDVTTIEQLSVTWPSGIQQHFSDVAAGKLIVLFERPAATSQPPATEPGSNSSGITVTDYRRVPIDIAPAGHLTASNQNNDSLPALTPAELAAAAEASPDSVRAEDSKLVVLTTMASWCASCAKHQPLLKEMSKEFEATDVSFIGFAGDPEDPADDLRGFVTRLNIDYPVAAEPDAALRSTVEAILNSGDGADVLPSTILLNSRGQVLATHSGIPTASELRRHLATMKSEPTE
jgi:thiol-disulfide isomerase/thioredoxin